MDSRRVEALADGIFTISMTLLVLELHVPVLAANASTGDLAKGLLHTWPKLVAYALGMAVSLLSPPAGLALYVLIPLLYLRRGTIDQHLAARHPPGSH